MGLLVPNVDLTRSVFDIEVPGQLAQNLENVAMIKYLLDNPDSILVIKDAEELIVSRDQKRNSNLKMILNNLSRFEER